MNKVEEEYKKFKGMAHRRDSHIQGDDMAIDLMLASSPLLSPLFSILPSRPILPSFSIPAGTVNETELVRFFSETDSSTWFLW